MEGAFIGGVTVGYFFKLLRFMKTMSIMGNTWNIICKIWATIFKSNNFYPLLFTTLMGKQDYRCDTAVLRLEWGQRVKCTTVTTIA